MDDNVVPSSFGGFCSFWRFLTFDNRQRSLLPCASAAGCQGVDDVVVIVVVAVVGLRQGVDISIP